MEEGLAKKIKLDSDYENLHDIVAFKDSANIIDALKNAHKQNKSIYLENTALIVTNELSFPVCQLFNFFDHSLLHQVKTDLLNVPFSRKDNDLFSFQQSSDLKAFNIPSISSLLKCLHSSWIKRDIIEKITGVNLSHNSDPDVAAQIYEMGDYLLCHDDDIAVNDSTVRRIAFIIYMVDEDWSHENDGGNLELFSCTSSEPNFPGSAVSSIFPKWNSIAFFEVTPNSYHQVQEVISATKRRLSVTGWFYGPHKKFHRIHGGHLLEKLKREYSFLREIENRKRLETWISPVYLKQENIDKLKNRFLSDSTLRLRQFMIPDAFNRCVVELDDMTNLQEEGPYNVRKCFSVLDIQKSQFMTDFCGILCNVSFHEWLCEITGFDRITGYYNNVQKFTTGCYTLLHDDLKEPVALDLIFHLGNFTKWDEDWGGSTVYVSGDEDLLSVQPIQNELTLVFRDADVLRFTKYLNNQSNCCNGFYRICYSYEID